VWYLHSARARKIQSENLLTKPRSTFSPEARTLIQGFGVAEMYSFTRKYVITSLAEFSVSTHLCVSVFLVTHNFPLLCFVLQNLSNILRKRSTEDQQFHILDYVVYERNKLPHFLRSVMFLNVNVT